MILINNNWENVRGIDDVYRILSESISYEFADDVKRMYRGERVVSKVDINNTYELVCNVRDLIAFISQYINDEFASRVSQIFEPPKQVKTNNNVRNTTKAITDYQSYMRVLKQHYLEYKEEIFLPSKIQNFINKYQLDSKLGIHSDDVMKDLWKIRKTAIEENNSTRIPPEQPKDKQTSNENITHPVQTQCTQNKTVSNTSTVNTPIRQTLSKQRFNFQGYETSYPNLSDIRGKVLEVILLSGSDDNGFFNYYANVAKNLLPSWGRNIVPQNDRQKSIVVKDNEYWICQYFYNPYDTSVDGIVEYTLHLDSNGKISVAWDDTDDMIPDTDIYRTGMTPLWTVLGDFISLPTTYDQRKEIATWVEKSSQGTFIYEEQYHDIRSYSLGRSATLEETAMLLSIEDVWAKVEFVKK